MRYTQRQLIRLIEAVEADGGEHLDELCLPTTYEFVGEKDPPQGNVIVGCGHMTLFKVPVPGRDPIKLCGVCDDLGKTPRYEGVMTA